MDAIQLLMMLFLNLSEPCTALPAQLQSIGRQNFQVMNYHCGGKDFKVWQRWCREGQGFWSRPFMLTEENTQEGIYMNQFGELVTGYHVTLDKIYIPRCGA